MMNILLVSNAVIGGAGKACLRLAHALNKQEGVEARILILEGKSDPSKGIYAHYPSVSKLFLKQLTSTPRRILNKLRFGALRKNLRVPKTVHDISNHELMEWADVINLHWVADFVDYRSFFRNVHKPILWTMHDMLPFSGGYHYEIEKPTGADQVVPRIEKYKRKCVSKANLRILAPSQWLLEVSKEHQVFSDFPHRRIFNTLDLSMYKPFDSVFSRTALNLPLNKRIIVFSADGLSNRRKGFQLLQEALNLIDLSHSHLLILGRGQVYIPSKVETTRIGHLSDELSMAIAYNASDISVIPSLEDNMPNAVIESLACGCPVVAFPTGGIPELVKTGKTGILCDFSSAEELAQAIKRGLELDFNKEELRKELELRLNENQIALEYLDEYNKALAVGNE